MKKMYIKPVIKEFQIVAQQTLMAGSAEVYNDDFNSETMTPLSRSGRGGFYDDYEEE